MKRLLKIGLAVTGLIVVTGLVAFYFLLSVLAKRAIETAGPAVTGTPVTVESVAISPFSGSGRIRGLVVGNPEGFQTPTAFTLTEVRVNISLLSLLTDRLRIEEIYIDRPGITFERTTTGSNIGKIQEHAKRGSAPTEPGKESASRPVEIDELVIQGARVTFKSGRAEGTVPIPTIRLHNLGKGSNGTTAQEVIAQVLTALRMEIAKAGLSAGALLDQPAKEAGSAAGKAIKRIFGK